MRFLALSLALMASVSLASSNIELSSNQLDHLAELVQTDVPAAIAEAKRYLDQDLAEHSRLQVSAHYCVALNTASQYKQVNGLIDSLKPWLVTTPHINLKAQLYSCQAIAIDSQGNNSDAIVILNKAIAEIDNDAYPYATSYLLSARGLLHSYSGDYLASIDDQTAAMKNYKRSPQEDQEHAMRMLAHIGIAYSYLELYDKALDAYQQVVRYLNQEGKQADEVVLLYNIATIYRKKGDAEQTRRWAQRSRERATDINDKTGIAYAEMLIASSYGQQQQYIKALNIASSVRKYFEQHQEPTGQSSLNAMQAKWLNAIGDYNNALPLAQQARDYYQRSQAPYAEMLAIQLLSKIYENLGNPTEALSLARQQVSLAKQLYNTDITEHIARIQTEFQLDLQEKETQLLRYKQEAAEAELAISKTKQSAGLIIAAAATMFILLLSILLTRSRRLAKRLAHTANVDSLTELPNRRYFLQQLELEYLRSKRLEKYFTLALIDVDHFKAINDTYGHQFGDKVLKEVGQQLKYHCRSHDICARYGGEEFLVLLPETNEVEAIQALERMRLAVEMIELPQQHQVTVSLGIATCGPGCNIDILLQKTDQALYFSKENGRNRSTHFNQIASEKSVAPNHLQRRSPTLALNG